MFFLKFIYFIYFLFLAALGLYFWLCAGFSLVAVSRGHSSLRCAGLSLRWPPLLQSTGSGHAGPAAVAHGLSSCGSWAPERRPSSCGARVQLLRSMWDPPGPGLEPVSPALAGGFSTSAPPGKPETGSFEAGDQSSIILVPTTILGTERMLNKYLPSE